MIRNSIVDVDDESNVYIQGKRFKGTKGLWELLTRKKVNRPGRHRLPKTI
jgi:hypothetical protein